MGFTKHNTFRFLVQFGALCQKPWHLKHCWIESVVLNSSILKILSVFWHTIAPEMSASTVFGSSHTILMKGRSLPGWVILLKSSSSSLKTKTFPFVSSAE